MHEQKVDAVFRDLSTSKNGLSSSEAAKRLKKYGPNRLQKKKGRHPFWLFVDQFKSFLVYILFAAVIISALLKEYESTIAIFVILIINGILGFIQEYRAEKSIEALKKMESVKAIVIRNGKEQKIDASELVPGDILVIEEGDRVSADSRLFEVNELQTLEASLTGESTPVSKTTDTLKKETHLADRKNMVFSGTIVTKGRAQAVVVGTGMNTEIGHIANLIQEAHAGLTPLQRKLQGLGKWIGIATIIIAIIVFVVGLMRAGVLENPAAAPDVVLQLFLVAIALAVAAVPEGLPAVVTVSLGLGVRRMVAKNALIRKLPSVETLGSTTVICSDKTGTFTKNEMTVRKLYVDGSEISVSGTGYSLKGAVEKKTKSLPMLLQIGLLCNNAQLQEKGIIGDPTEAALLVSGEKGGFARKKMRHEWKRQHEIVFDSNRKMMSTINTKAGKTIMHTKGAVDNLLKRCKKILINGKVATLTATHKKEILSKNESFAKDALRVLGFAYKESKKSDHKEDGLVFVGMQAMIDPPRPEVKDALTTCKKAGIKVVMITGDHKITAEAIARELGLEGRAVEGKDLKGMNLSKEIEKIAIIARASPEEKINVIEALKKKGHVVAMTGDGVNDAPALKKADIGIAMGIKGTEVSKEASDMILTDDNFASIVNAVEEGRGIYDNIKKFVNYLLSSNVGEVLTLFLAIIIGFSYEGVNVIPLLAIHLLFVNLITDGLPALALGIDPHSKTIMDRKPRNPKEGILNENMTLNVLVIGGMIAAGVLWLFNYGLQFDPVRAQTIAFTSLVVFEIVRVYMIRSQYNIGVFSNLWLLLAIVSSLALQLLVIYSPLSHVFEVVALPLIDWAYIGGVTLVLLVAGLFISRIIQLITHEMD